MHCVFITTKMVCIKNQSIAQNKMKNTKNLKNVKVAQDLHQRLTKGKVTEKGHICYIGKFFEDVRVGVNPPPPALCLCEC